MVSSLNKVQCSPGGAIDMHGSLSSIPGTSTQLGCTLTANGVAN
jgi:hypothetical protein